ncbi:IclR family transcriptional regulator [Aquabacterium sp.]|uniref:IclR family transcriptional regulator n=1 Tax=Aquabacterium sp. TaxID=1872578 RepID=UPI0035AF2E8E
MSKPAQAASQANQLAPESDSTERQGIQVIARAAAMLRALAHHPEGLSLGELAREVTLPRSTVQRIVDALDKEGLVLAASSVSGVRLGPALLSLAAATRFHMAELARETLENLSKATRETVDLSVLDQDKVVFIDQVAGSQRLSAVSAVGVSFPLHCSANGKALLAAMSDDELRKVRKRLVLARQTDQTITDWARLEEEIQAVRRDGFACDREENSEGICAVSTLIRSATAELAAISIPVPAQRFRHAEAELIAMLLQHARALQQKLGR